jgi:hypothetical protein
MASAAREIDCIVKAFWIVDLELPLRYEEPRSLTSFILSLLPFDGLPAERDLRAGIGGYGPTIA